ncbi:tetratricopeptide repeat protein [Francisella uliginis]|uniref:Beta-lactamase n=1 Tax=Francisella uliginis TaxID=573570 RepID=A0A1L4BT43_9GAMM|nr:tetratricopeptide repeat protein [Francisella uliginis]API87020.1 hypothetical protein F7310_06460 [Francisella uliginis]
MYAKGQGTEVNLHKSFELDLDLAESGDEIGIQNMAYDYTNGVGVKKDISKAIYWNKQAVEKFNSIDAMLNLASIYEDQDNSKEIIYWKTKVGENGFPIELFDVAAMHRFGYNNTKIDYNKAIAVYKKILKTGHYKGDAAYGLGDMYYKQKKYKQAFKWYAVASDKYHFAAANASLAQMYQNGIGVSKNTTKAIELYKKDYYLSQGFPSSKSDSVYALANIYLKQKNLDKSLYWLRVFNAIGVSYVNIKNKLVDHDIHGRVYPQVYCFVGYQSAEYKQGKESWDIYPGGKIKNVVVYDGKSKMFVADCWNKYRSLINTIRAGHGNLSYGEVNHKPIFNVRIINSNNKKINLDDTNLHWLKGSI